MVNRKWSKPIIDNMPPDGAPVTMRWSDGFSYAVEFTVSNSYQIVDAAINALISYHQHSKSRPQLHIKTIRHWANAGQYVSDDRDAKTGLYYANVGYIYPLNEPTPEFIRSHAGDWYDAARRAIAHVNAMDAFIISGAVMAKLTDDEQTPCNTLACIRCGHTWIPRNTQPPKFCPHCNSPYWDKPRLNQ
jgi:hypothetical protein